MNSKQTEEDYVPYGPEWEKEMSKFPKVQLVKMLGKAYQEKKELKQSLPSKPVGDVEENPMWELWKQDKIPDLTDATPEQKANMVNGLIETMAKETLKLFKALGLKTHIESKVINDPTGEVFNFSFTKSGYAADPQKGMDIREKYKQWCKETKRNGSVLVGSSMQEFFNWLDESPSPSEAGDGWVRVEDGLPEVDTPVYVRTEYKSSGKPMVDFFTAYMDEYGDTIICPHDESYGWQFNDCVTHWHPCIPAPPIQKTVK